MFIAPGMKVSPARDAPTPEEMSPFAPYRGPLVDGVTTEVVPPEDTPPPFVRLMEGDIDYPELRQLVDLIFGNETPDDDPPPATPGARVRWEDNEEDDQTLPRGAERDQDMYIGKAA